MPEVNKRLRIIAGPNGSEKSTFIDTLRRRFECGVYVNTDEIEKTLKETGFINLSNYSVSSSTEIFENFIQKEASQSLIRKANSANIPISISFEDNIILTKGKSNSYEAALVGEFIKDRLLEDKKALTFETAMSHDSKVDFIKKAIADGYLVYLYFISTESVEINIGRVGQRVLKKGHDVEEAKIRERYIKSSELLSKVIPLTYRTFLFDNSTEKAPLKLAGEIFKGQGLTVHTDEIPQWIYTYCLRTSEFRLTLR